jgi:catechol 2,3-dioxygenase
MGRGAETARKLMPVERATRPIAAGVDIGHVHLRTADIDRVHDFYVGVLGFDVIARMPDAGLYHVAIRYPTRAALADALRRLSEARWPLDGATDHGTHEALYLSDPDRNGLELYWDRPEAEWPIDEDGRLGFAMAPLDLQDLLAAAE